MNYDAKFDTMNVPEMDEAYPADARHGARLNRRIWLFAGLAILAILAIWFAVHSRNTPATDTGVDTQIPVVSVDTPGCASIVGEITGTGSIAARRKCRSARWAMAGK